MATKQLYVTGSLITVGLAMAFGFQNCGGPGSGNSTASSQNTVTSTASPTATPAAVATATPTPVPVVEAFTSGSAFNYSLVTLQSQMIQTQLTASSYMTSTAARSVAVNAAGLGYVSIVTDGNQAEATQLALESCYAIGGSKPCVTLANAGTFALQSSDLANTGTFTFSIPTNTTVTSTNIPFLTFANRAAAATGFAAASTPKAMAISIDSTYMVSSASAFFGTLTDSRKLSASAKQIPASDAEAQRMALETCEMMSKYMPCTIFAVDSAVTLVPTSFNYTPVINYAPTSITEVPGVSASVFTADIKPGLSTDYVYISADGDGGASSSQSTAMSQCSSNQAVSNSGIYPCFEYSQGNTVKMNYSNLTAVRSNSLTTHCDIMPRASCSAHAAVGCVSGKFYVETAAGPQLMTCP